MATDLNTVMPGGAATGVPILVTGTDTAGAVTLHTATSTVDTHDDLCITAANAHTADIDLTIEFGAGQANPTIVTVPAKAGFTLVLDKVRVSGGVVVKAYAGTANKVRVALSINRVTNS
jgi:hypothetical protein